jgi:hypothetical protein
MDLTPFLPQTADCLWPGLLAELAGMPVVTRLGALATGLAIGVLVMWHYARAKSSHAPPATETSTKGTSDPAKLFGELCQAHRLTAAQKRLLEWLVAERQLAQPALVFLDPILLESAVLYAESPAVRKRLTQLRAKLFAGLEAATEP